MDPDLLRRTPIAVVGLGSLFPGSESPAQFWRDIVQARDRLTEVPASHWLIEDYYDPDPTRPDKTYSKRGGFLPSVPFDPMEFGIPPNSLPSTDTVQLLSLIVARDVLDDATRGGRVRLDRDRTSVMLGFAGAAEAVSPLVARLQRPVWARVLRERGMPEAEIEAVCDRIAAHYVPWQESSFPGLLGNVVAGRIANRLDLHGANLTLDAACASSLAALHAGVSSLLLGESDLVVTGGADANNDIFAYMCFSKTPAISPSDDCRPFSDDADGMMMGEGIGMLALKRLADAERDGSRVYALLRGIGTSSDGRSRSIYAPRSDGQARALRRAYEQAGYGPDSVELIEAHGTGTKAGDAAEIEGLKSVFQPGGEPVPRPWCAIGSVKSQIGHTAAAAGAAGLLKAVMALHRKVLPPTAKVRRPDPQLKFEGSPLYVNTEARPWVRAAAHPRRASVSAFGFGGTNYHVTLEEYTGPADSNSRVRGTRNELFLYAADDASALAQQCDTLAREGWGEFASRARASQLAFDAARSVRLAIVAESPEDLGRKLREAARVLAASPTPEHRSPDGVWIRSGAPVGGEVAVLFPGQGSQFVSMGGALATLHPAARRVWDTLADTRFDGTALHERVFPPPAFDDEGRKAQEAALRETAWAQPALGAASLAAWQLVGALGLAPRCFLGHSFGELSALCAAGSFDIGTLVQLARHRGEMMRDAAQQSPGGMLALAVDAARAGALLERARADAVVANINAPDEVVVSGSLQALEKLEALCAREGVTARRLPVAAAFHSPAVAGASSAFGAKLAGVALVAPRVDVLANADAQPYPQEPQAIRQRLAAQLAQPVRFADQIEQAWALGVRRFVEVGPGAVLSELTRRVLRGRPHVAVSLDRKGADGVTSLHHALAQLAVAGTPIAYEALWEGFEPTPDRPVKRSASVVTINGANHGKLYPAIGPDGTRGRGPALRPAVGAGPAAASTAGAITGASQTATPGTAAEAGMVVAPVFPGVPAMPATTPAAAPLPFAGPGAASGHGPAGPRPQAAGAAADADWLQAWQSVQQKVAETHAEVSRAMAESHAAFLAAMSGSLADLNAFAGGQPLPATFAAAPQAPGASAVARSAWVHPAPPARAALAPQPIAAVPASAPQLDLAALLLAIVAEKTGYQADLLGLHMDLEADLGIDSIKRVEILAALRDAVPTLPDLPAADLAGIRTLGDVLSRVGGAGAATAEVARPAASPAEGAAATAPATPAASTTDAAALTQLLLATVAEKTGYQSELLGLHMDLEADLGIDSIKRVEILAALRDAAPHLPDVAAADMARIRTLGDVLARISGSALADAPAAAEAVAASPPAATTATTRESAAAPASSAQQFAAETETRAIPLARAIVRLAPVAAPGLALGGLFACRNLAVTDDGGGVGKALVQRLVHAGVTATLVAQPPADADGVVFLGGLAEPADLDAALAVQRAAFHAARGFAARELPGGVFVTVQDTGGDFGLGGRAGARAWIAGLAGLARTARLEWPSAAVKAIDCERAGRSPDAVALALAAELLGGGDTPDVGLAADGSRQVPLAVPAGPPRQGRPLEPGAVVLASGGARGVTAACLLALAQVARPHLVLLGRTALADDPPEVPTDADEAALTRWLLSRATGVPPGPAEVRRQAQALLARQEIRATLAALEAGGARATYLSVDLQDAAAVRRAIDGVRERHGAIQALVHGAGVLADRRIADKTDAQFERVVDTKVRGLRHLLDATAADPLSAIVLFSSVAARAGNAGQCDYALANEVLNQVAAAEQARRGPGCNVRAIAWGPWDGGMVTPPLRAHFQRLQVPLIGLAEGAARFVEELQAAAGEPVVLLGGELAAGVPVRPRTSMDLRLARPTHPYLADHAVRGQPVVPIALVLEWFLRAAHGLGEPGRPVLRSLRVLRGLKLQPGLPGERVVIHRLGSADGHRLELRGPANDLHYAAELAFEHGTPDLGREGSDLPPAQGPARGAELYDGTILFHGPAFQALRSVASLGDDGLVAEVAGLASLGWPDEPWRSDPAAVDAMLQLGSKWSERGLGGGTLPMAVGALHWLAPGPVSGPLRATARTRSSHHARWVCDLALATPEGTPVAWIEGAEFVRRPDVQTLAAVVEATP